MNRRAPPVSAPPPAPPPPPAPRPPNLLGAPVVRRSGTVVSAPQRKTGPVRRAVERGPMLWPYKLAGVTLLALLAGGIALLALLGFDALYATSGRVELGRLQPFVAGPVEVYVLPELPPNLEAFGDKQVRAFIFSAKHDWNTRPGGEQLPPPEPRVPPTLGELVRDAAPPQAYGVGDGRKVSAHLLPVAPAFREPRTPYQLSLLPEKFYRKYNQAMYGLTAEGLTAGVDGLLAVVADDLADARTRAQQPGASQAARLTALMELAWLTKFEEYLRLLPANEAAIRAQAAARPVQFMRDMPVLVHDLDFAAAALGRAKLNSDGSFNAPGGGVVVVRVPLADGTGLFLTGMDPLFQGKIQSSARLSPDFGHWFALLRRGGEPLPAPRTGAN